MEELEKVFPVSCILLNLEEEMDESEVLFTEDFVKFPPGCADGVSFKAFSIFAVSELLFIIVF